MEHSYLSHENNIPAIPHNVTLDLKNASFDSGKHKTKEEYEFTDIDEKLAHHKGLIKHLGNRRSQDETTDKPTSMMAAHHKI